MGGLNLPVARGTGKQPRKPYPDDVKVKRWVGWMARRFREADQTEIFIEKLQPKFLVTRWQKVVYGLVGGLVVRLVYGLVYGLVVGLVVGLVFWLVFGLGGLDGDIGTVETIEFFWRSAPKKFYEKLRKNLVYGLFGVLFGGLVGGLVVRLVYGLVFGLVYGLVVGLVYGLVVGLVLGLVETFTGAEITTKKQDNQGIFQSAINSIFFGVMFMPLGMAIAILAALDYANPNTSLSLTAARGFLFGALSGGLTSAIEHFVLRVTLWLFGYSPWNYSRFLRYCTERGFLQRVGGGYRFVHALLRDHFADTEPCPNDPTAPPTR
jgi:hypothetical protein